MSQEALQALRSLSEGFRQRYLDYKTLTRQLHAWADHYPQVARLRSLGQSPEGRELWLLTVGPDPQRPRPAVWVDGNMHAVELAGSSVALAIAEDALALHLAPDEPLRGLPDQVRRAARETLFHIMPRISPDGAEQQLESGRYVRSVPRDPRPHRAPAHWQGADVDGDGEALYMRQRDPTGEYVECAEHPGLMLQRRIDDPPPFYKLYPEGFIANFNGRDIPTPHFMADNAPDLNRNFPYQWVPEHEQAGAGAYPGSEPESQAILKFATANPSLFAWLNLHTFGGVFIRPPGHCREAKMDRADLALYRQVADWAEALTGYPTVASYEEFTYEPEVPLHGDLTDYAYHQRGCLALVCELWDLFAQLGVPRRRPFIEHYNYFEREDARRLARWDREHNGGRIFRPWRAAHHPQLGEVELGGPDPRVGIFNPPYERLDELCRAVSALWLRVASLAPRVRIDALEVEPLGDDTRRLTLTVSNHGYLPTYVLNSARPLEWNEPLHAELTLEGCELAVPDAARLELGHLDGWGRGLHSEEHSLFAPASRGSTGRRNVNWILRGRGRATVRVGSCRVGWQSRRVEVGP